MTSGLRPQCLRSAGGYHHLPPTRGGQPGGLGVRLGARIIDGILISIIAVTRHLVFTATAASGLQAFLRSADVHLLRRFRSDSGLDIRQEVAGAQCSRPHGAPKPTAKESAIAIPFTLRRSFRSGIARIYRLHRHRCNDPNAQPTKQGKRRRIGRGHTGGQVLTTCTGYLD